MEARERGSKRKRSKKEEGEFPVLWPGVTAWHGRGSITTHPPSLPAALRCNLGPLEARAGEASRVSAPLTLCFPGARLAVEVR